MQDLVHPFDELIAANKRVYTTGFKLLALDPGRTTGYAIFNGIELVTSGQLYTPNGNPDEILKLITKDRPTVIVLEKYIIYGNKFNEHVGSSVETLRLIGALEYICRTGQTKLVQQRALEVKQFMTDDKLKAWDMWNPNQRHANDAVRHGCYYLLFGK